MFQSYFVYSTILLSIVVSSYAISLSGNRKIDANSYNISYIFPYWLSASFSIIIFAFIEGFRYDVGIDFMQNFHIFEYLQNDRIYREKIDPLYLWIITILVYIGFIPSSLFILASFLFLFSYYYLLRERRQLIIFALPVYLLFALNAENLIRQFFAMAILIIGITHLLRGEKLKYGIWAVCAFFIHSSSIIAAPVYFLLTKVKNIKLAYILIAYCLAWYLGPAIFQALKPVVLLFNNVGIMQNYTGSADKLLDDTRMDLFYQFSVYSLTFSFLRNLFLIIVGYRLLRIIKNKDYPFFYYNFALFACLKPMFFRHELFNRLVHYYDILTPVLIGYIGYEVFYGMVYKKNKLKRNAYRTAILLIIAFTIYSFYAGVNNNAIVMRHPFTFIWD